MSILKAEMGLGFIFLSTSPTVVPGSSSRATNTQPCCCCPTSFSVFTSWIHPWRAVHCAASYPLVKKLWSKETSKGFFSTTGHSQCHFLFHCRLPKAFLPTSVMLHSTNCDKMKSFELEPPKALLSCVKIQTKFPWHLAVSFPVFSSPTYVPAFLMLQFIGNICSKRKKNNKIHEYLLGQIFPWLVIKPSESQLPHQFIILFLCSMMRCQKHGCNPFNVDPVHFQWVPGINLKCLIGASSTGNKEQSLWVCS